MLGEFIEPFISAMKSSLWDNFAIYAIAFAAFLLLIKVAQNRTSQAISQLIGVVVIITMAFVFYAYPIQMMEGIDTVTSGISDAVMEGPYQATIGGTAVDAKGKATALCWNIFVHKPWQMLEFGTISNAKKYEGDILKLKPESDQRIDLVEKLAESEGLFSKSAEYQGNRLAMIIIFLCFNILLMIVMIIFSVLIIGFQFLLIVYLMLGIFVFLAALLPNLGIELLMRWITRVISISFTKIMVVFFLSVTLVFMDVIYGFTEKFGIFLTIFLMLVIIGMLWFERYRFLDLFAGYRSTNNQLPQTMKKSLETDYNAVDNIRSVRKTMLRNLDSMHTGNTGGMNSENEQQEEGVRGQQTANPQNVRFSTGRGEAVGIRAESMETAGEKMQQSAEAMRTSSQDMSIYFKSAEALLQKQYEYASAKAEETATKNNEPVDYDGFVKRTDRLRGKEQGNFDKRDVTNVANIMKRTVEQGGSIDDVVSDGKSIYRDKQRNTRPASLSSVRENINTEASPIRKQQQDKQYRGIEYFKMNFGEEQGEELYGNMAQKYGGNIMASFVPEMQMENQQGSEGDNKTMNEKSKIATGNEQKMSYAQIVKQLQKQNNQNRPNNQPVVKQNPQNPQEPTKLRKGDK